MAGETKITCVADLGSALRRARKELGLTQQQTADFCGVSVTYLYQLEKGKETVEFGKAIDIARRLGIDLLARRR